MDFMRLLRSFEDFIFEAASWLIFYPLTLWRIFTRPLRTMGYSDAQQSASEERRYDDALSPPLLLLLTVVWVNLVGHALHVPPPSHPTSDLGRAIFGSPQTLAVIRSVIFSLVPLVSATTLLRRKGIHLSRETLRGPFYAQCYLAAPCAIMVGIGVAIFRRPDVSNLLGAALFLGGGAWFLATETRWFAKRLPAPWPQAMVVALWAIAKATAYLLALMLPLALLL